MALLVLRKAFLIHTFPLATLTSSTASSYKFKGGKRLSFYLLYLILLPLSFVQIVFLLSEKKQKMGLNQVLDFAMLLCWVFLLALLVIAAKASSVFHSDQMTWSLPGGLTDLHFITLNKAFLNYLLSSIGFVFKPPCHSARFQHGFPSSLLATHASDTECFYHTLSVTNSMMWR